MRCGRNQSSTMSPPNFSSNSSTESATREISAVPVLSHHTAPSSRAKNMSPSVVNNTGRKGSSSRQLQASVKASMASAVGSNVNDDQPTAIRSGGLLDRPRLEHFL